MDTTILNNIKAIQIESPVDKIIGQLKQLIIGGQLKPGDRLPAERVLAEQFGVGRSYIREAILKLEFYGLLKTSPQSGTYVAGLGINILDNIITDIINFNKDDFNALIEARYYLELASAKLAAERHTDADLREIKKAAADFENKVKRSGSAVEEDMVLHIKIAKATKNPAIESMILILIPDLIKNIVENNVCGKNRSKTSVPEHKKIVKAIEDRNVAAAEKAMAEHLNDIWQISKAGFEAKKLIAKKQ
ncbi:GntR family transcriptional regulator [Niabella ginsenosidivorans]|uniref:GntR family transcriptional regulator n=1 Tax=Niabella ginsenosidivorans TaxID=1176587 RepID=A0A1A9I5C3_9BACT|nr:FadR/GntR family transcriptional regulator [Niabella ginsenosidivorans]ANH82887.1 GntR family transcriptional regulator [Niabella ginsenosidivorans]